MLTATLLSCALAVTATAPWDGAPFQASPDAIRTAAAALPRPVDADVDLLLEERTFAFDAQGRMTFTYRMVFRPLTAEAARQWAAFSMSWAPWYQERPDIRARIIAPNGEVHTLDPATCTEAGADDNDSEVYTNRRTLRAPLPAVESGAVVEEVATVRDVALDFDAGSVGRFYLGRIALPMRRVALHLEAAPGIHLDWRGAGGISGAPSETVRDGRRLLTWDWKDVKKQLVESDLPPDVHARPQITFTTGTSWSVTAGRYLEMIERQLTEEDLAATARGLVAPDDSVEVSAQKLFDWMSARVRYTGLELNEAALVPARPHETLQRHFGDCKDLALLLVGLLRATGHPATLALLSSGAEDVDPNLPGIGLFNHAIVYVPSPRPLFIDATSPSTRVGDLPSDDQGRLALVLARDTKALTPTPLAKGSDNATGVRREIVLSDDGLAHVIQTSEYRGPSAARIRAWRRPLVESDPKVHKGDEEATLEFLNAKKFVGFSVQGLEGAAVATVRREADESLFGVVNGDEAEAIATPRPALDYFPKVLVPAEETKSDESKSVSERRNPLWIAEPLALELKYEIVPPEGFHSIALPANARRAFGPLSYEASYAVAADEKVTISYRLVLDGHRITPADVKTVREGFVQIRGKEELKIRFRRKSNELLDAGKGREAIEELRRLIALHPTQARYHALLANALVQLGMVDAARREARLAVKLEPADAWPHRVLSFALTYDTIGRPLHPGCDLAGAIAEQRRAVELKPEPAFRARLAFLLEHDVKCERFAEGARLGEAIAVFRSIHEDSGNHDFDGDYAEALLAAGKVADARALARPLAPSPERAGVMLAAAAVDAPESLEREAQELAPSERRTGLLRAWQHLALRRMYPELAALMRKASTGVERSAELRELADAIARIRRHPEGQLDSNDPQALFGRIYRALAADDPDVALRSMTITPSDPAVPRAVSDLRRMIWRYAGVPGLPKTGTLDILDSLTTVKVEGDLAVGARVRVEFEGGRGPDLVAVRRNGSIQIALKWSRFSMLAAAARRRLDAGDAPGAAAILRLLPLEELPSYDGDERGSFMQSLWVNGATA